MACTAVFAVTARPAAAHGAFGSAAPFWSGVLHLWVSPLAIAALLGFAVASRSALTDRVLSGCALGAALAALLTWILPGASEPVAAASVAVLGFVAVASRGDTERRFLALGICAGIGVGASVEPDARGGAEALGVGVAAIIALLWMIELAALIRKRLPLADRVIGAWITSIALLVVAITVKRGWGR